MISPEPDVTVKLSWPDRLRLINLLNRMPLSQLLAVEFALCVPERAMPGLDAELGRRTRALLSWLESAAGPGHLGPLLELLAEMGMEVPGSGSTSAEKDGSQIKTLKIKLDQSVRELTREGLKGILSDLREIGQDHEIEIATRRPGCIELELQGTAKSLERLKTSVGCGEINHIFGFAVTDVQIVDEGLVLQYANLSRADLSHVDLSDANLDSADLSFTSFSKATLNQANLKSANLSFADLSKANLNRANLSNAHLISTGLISTDLSETDLSGAKFIGADFSEANLSGANLIGADLSDTDLSGANLSAADLRLADLIGAQLRNANLVGANLSGAQLSSAKLVGADLSKVKFSSANLSGANLRLANFSGAYLSGAKVTSTIFSSNSGISEAQKANLQARGAIFQDPPSSDVPNLVRR